MVPDFGVTSNARNRTRSFFRSVCFFSCEKSLCFLCVFFFFSISTSRSPVMLPFKIFYVLEFVNRLCTAFKNFRVKHVCIMTSGCIFKNGAPTQVLRKLRILTKFGLCYTIRGNVCKCCFYCISIDQVMQHFR